MTTVLNGYATAGRAPALDDYLPLLGHGEIDGIRALARPLRDRTVQMVNSTAVGGGVAEILNRLVPLALDLDIRIRWDVMDGGDRLLPSHQGVSQRAARRSVSVRA